MDVDLLKSVGDLGVTGILLLVTLLSFRERREDRKARDERERARTDADLEQTAALVELSHTVRSLVDRLPSICRASGATPVRSG